MLDPQAVINRIDSCLRRELEAELAWQGQMLSIALPVQEIHLRSLPTIGEEWFFWDRPVDDETILCLGSAMRVTAQGHDRLEILSRRAREISRDWNWIDPESTGFRPLSYFCFAFDPSDRMTGPWSGVPNSGLFLPELTLQQRDNRCAALFSVRLDPDLDTGSIHRRWMGLFTVFVESIGRPYTPPGCKTTLTRVSTSSDHTQWRRLVTGAQTSIAAGALQKVVPARHLRVQAERTLDPRQLMATLRYLYPNSILIATRTGGRTFVSATPERLVRHQNGEITCDALAGTIRRSAVEEIDRELGEQLLSDPKARHEHQLVVDDITASLQPLCSNIEYLKQPTLLRMRNLQHLSTEIRGRIEADTTLLQTADRLHPTAAVNGYPGNGAKAWLDQNERFDRGWYTGAAGWIDCDDNGELAVLLRCALLDRNHADLYAGAGITDRSDPDAEFSETELKFSVMLEALENA